MATNAVRQRCAMAQRCPAALCPFCDSGTILNVTTYLQSYFWHFTNYEIGQHSLSIEGRRVSSWRSTARLASYSTSRLKSVLWLLPNGPVNSCVSPLHQKHHHIIIILSSSSTFKTATAVFYKTYAIHWRLKQRTENLLCCCRQWNCFFCQST